MKTGYHRFLYAGYFLPFIFWRLKKIALLPVYDVIMATLFIIATRGA